MKYINLYIRLLLLLGLLLLLLGCREDPIELTLYGRLEGAVTNENLEPLENVIISTNPATEVITTGPEGTFTMDSIPIGNYVVRARLEEFEDELLSIEISDEKTTTLSIVMSVSPQDNQAPGLPDHPTPANGERDVAVTTELSWSCHDDDAHDTLQYDLVFFSAGNTPGEVIATGLQDTTYLMEALAYNTTYYWQIIASDGKHEPVHSEIWQFSTLPFPENRIHFVRKADGKYLIFSANDQGQSLAITTSQQSSWRPRLDPIRKNIAYLSFDGLESHLYIMQPDGSGNSKITSNVSVASQNNFEMSYCWSPDGAQLLYMHNRQLYRINKDGSGLQMIAQAPPNEVYTAVDWSPLGDKIILKTQGSFPYETNLYLSSNDGGFLPIMTDLDGTIGSPSFSIDGKMILFSYDVSEFQSPDGRQLDARVFLYNLETEVLTDISVEKEEGTNDLEPRFSPTGAHIIFTNTPNDGISRKDIWKMERDGENRVLFVENGEMPDWK